MYFELHVFAHNLCDLFSAEGQEHILMMIVSLLALSLYYPMASFLYPNMQFADKSLDIKFDTTFLIMVAQGKLFLAGISSYYKNSPEVIIFAALPLYLGFLLMNNSLKPCLIPLINPWRSLSYFCGVCLSGGAIYAIFTRQLCVPATGCALVEEQFGLNSDILQCVASSQSSYEKLLRDQNLGRVLDECNANRNIAIGGSFGFIMMGALYTVIPLRNFL